MKQNYPALLYSAPDVDYPGTHGGSTHVGEIVKALSDLCDRVYLICTHKKSQKYIEKRKQITIIRLPKLPTTLLRVSSYFLFPFIITFFLGLFNKIGLVYERGKIFGGGALFAGNLLGKKTIYSMIEPYTEIPLIIGQIRKNSFTHKFMQWWHKIIVQRADRITITHPIFLTTIPKEKSYFIHTGANPQKFNEKLPTQHLKKRYGLVKGKTLLYVGSFSKWHSCTTMIKAVMPLIKKDKQIKFLMLGKGERYETSKRLIEELKLEKNILLLGKMPFEQLPNYIAAADICFALFDRTYPPFKKLDYYYSPIKIHEYKASGKPIIASNIGTLKNYVVNGKNGYSVNEGNIKEITEAVNKLLTQKKKAQKIGQTNRKEIMTTYNWEVQSKRLLKELYGN